MKPTEKDRALKTFRTKFKNLFGQPMGELTTHRDQYLYRGSTYDAPIADLFSVMLTVREVMCTPEHNLAKLISSDTTWTSGTARLCLSGQQKKLKKLTAAYRRALFYQMSADMEAEVGREKTRLAEALKEEEQSHKQYMSRVEVYLKNRYTARGLPIPACWEESTI